VSYLQFHLVFLLPALALVAVPAIRIVREHPRLGVGVGVLVVLAYLWTTPWDNHLVATDVWGYGDGRVLATIGYVPVEEYAFFGLQTLLAGAVTMIALDRRGLLDGSAPQQRASRRTVAWWAVAGLLAAMLTMVDTTRYLGLILVWIVPPLAVQWWYGGRWLAERLRAIWPWLAVLTGYLWIADGYAIVDGIWSISDRYTTGLGLGPLPIEEATFFLVTTLVVAQGLILFASLRRKAPAWNR
jgi:lycopene beta-cyclase